MNTTTFSTSNNSVSSDKADKKSTLIDNVTEIMTIISMWAVTATIIGLVSLTWV